MDREEFKRDDGSQKNILSKHDIVKDPRILSIIYLL